MMTQKDGKIRSSTWLHPAINLDLDLKRWENKFINLHKSYNEFGPATDIQFCCRHSFIIIKGIPIHLTKTVCLSQQQCKFQSKKNKSVENNLCQENYQYTKSLCLSTQHIKCEKECKKVKKNYYCLMFAWTGML